MKRPEKKVLLPKTMDEQIEFGYRESDIDLILDKLEALRGAEEFPTLDEFKKWYNQIGITAVDIYNYFLNRLKTRTIEVMPELGKMYEFSDDGNQWDRDKLVRFESEYEFYTHIRPIPKLTRDEVITKAKELGLTEAELEVLCTK